MPDLISAVKTHLDELLKSRQHILVAIDGNCTAGKSTLASLLEKEYDCKIKVGYTEGYPPIYNNPDLYASYIDNLTAGLDFIEMPEPAMISEDYSYFGFEAPSIFFYVGTGTGIALHSNNFDFDEAVLVQGVELYKILLNNQ
jgi:hippurate hydrolase